MIRQRRESKEKSKRDKKMHQVLMKQLQAEEMLQSNVEKAKIAAMNPSSHTEAVDIANSIPKATEFATKLRSDLMAMQYDISNQNRQLQQET